MARFKEYVQNQIMLLPPNLEEKVAPNHLARYISRAIDQIDLSRIEVGRLQKELQEDIVFMWLSGMQEPDFRTISDFRKDRVSDIKQIFNEVLEICAELGMVRCGKISIDGTKIEANSGKHKITFRKKLEKSLSTYRDQIDAIMKEAEKVDAEEDQLYGETDGYSVDSPCTSEDIGRAIKRLRQKQARLEREKEKLELEAEVVEDKLKLMGENRNSYGNTDPDATLMLMKDESLGVGYNVQMATENQVIVAFGYSRDRVTIVCSSQ